MIVTDKDAKRILKSLKCYEYKSRIRRVKQMDELDDLKRRVILQKLGLLDPVKAKEVKQMDETTRQELDDIKDRLIRIEKILDIILEDGRIYRAVGFNASEELKRLKSDLRYDLYGYEED